MSFLVEYLLPVAQLLSLVAILLVALQISQQNRIKAVDLVKDYTIQFYSAGLHPFFQDLSYDADWKPNTIRFDATVGKATSDEVRAQRHDDLLLAQLLDLLNSVCYAVELKLLSSRAISNTILGYAIFICWQHKGVQHFLEWIDGDRKNHGNHKAQLAFQYFRKYAPYVAAHMS